MVSQKLRLFAILVLLALSSAAAAEDVQWVRVTALLEPGPGATVRLEQTMVPGGVYSLAEVDERGLDSVDEEILDRVRRLGESMRGVEDSMRLATLLARQYYLPLEIGETAVLPVIDLNPRLGIVFAPQRFGDGRLVCRVQFLEPDGPPASGDFTGEPITLRLHDANLQDVLRTFSKLLPVEIVVEPSVTGTVTVDLRQVPWDQALDLVLRINNLGWVKEGDTLRVGPLDEMSRRKKVRTDTTINLPRETWGSATIASQGDAENPTVVLLVESVDEPPQMVAERDGLVYPRQVLLVEPPPETFPGDLAVFRAMVTSEGNLRDAKVLVSPSEAYAARLADALADWKMNAVLDAEGRKQEAIVGYGVRLLPQRVLASIGDVEHIGVEIEAKPVQDDSPLYVIQAQVTDLDSGELLSAPRIRALRGDEAMVQTSFVAPSGNPTMIEMKFFVSEDGSRVTYSWTLTSDGKVVNSHKAEFSL